ncbi:MAG: ABC transporter permease [Bacteroides sp.]|nr:ABC transporter permease [Bacillota bacterium]MCM1393366.1 ABC transporter permease [[Eubacterium] siraeum]MCM1454920.1 ABC transporter permease [Bacteroides sp.]
METLKYIVKRLVLAIVILLGVSVIIYGMSRMMPTDYVDQQYESQLSQGTMTQADVDHIKELYGLSMPDAFLTITVGEGSKYAGMKFTANTKQTTYEDEVAFGSKSYKDWYTGSTDKTTNATMAYDNGNTRLLLKQDGTCQLGTFTSRDLIPPEEITDDAVIKADVVFIPEEEGRFTIVESDDMEPSEFRKNIIVSLGGGNTVTLTVGYRNATGGEKFVAILDGYFTWLGNLLQGDLGMSFKHKQPVSDVILENMGISFAIAFIATILQFLIAIPLGIKAATHQYGAVDYTVTILTMMGISLPTFFFAAIVIRVFAVELGWFDVQGISSATLPVDASWIVKLGDTLWHMVLPMLVLVILSIGSLMRYTRTNTLEALNADYVRTARAKGLSEKTVIYKHAFRNTMVPLVTLLAGILPSLFGGAMITEQVFSIPGIGQKAYEALIVADVPFIMGYNMFMAILTVIGTLLSDLMYAVVDPRVKLGR